MKLRHDDVREKDSFCAEKETEKKNWYNKLWDVTARMGKILAKTLCVVSVPVLVASCSCGKMELEGDTHTTPDITDVSHDDAREEDTVNEDVPPEDVVEEDVPEEELPPPCDYLYERSGINNLIGDYLNRRLDDRLDNVPETDPGYTDAAYPLGDSDIPDTANPFSDGMGGSIGPSETFMHMITEHGFAPLASDPVYDADAAITYTETQSIWVRGSSYYSDVLDDVTGDVRFVAYTMKFEGESDDFGIRVCSTHPHEGDYTYCKSGAEDASYDLATELHKVRVEFLGEPWVITEMSPPIGELTNEMQVYPGGYVKIAQEAVSGVVNQGESLPAGTLRFQLDDVEAHDGMAYAIISVLNEDGDILMRDRIAPGQTKEFSIDGEVYLLHVYKVASGYTIDARWADMAILSREMKIEDGQHLDPDYDIYRNWQSVVGWKNKGASSTDTKPDHLRTVGIYADDVAAISSSGESTLLPGEGFEFPESGFALCYGGLDITDEEKSALKFEIENDATFMIAETRGPYHPTTGERCGCELYPPYVKVSSGESGAVFELEGTNGIDDVTLSDNQFYVTLAGAGCYTAGGEACGPGFETSPQVFMKLSPSADQYGYHEYERTDANSTAILYGLAGEAETWGEGGVIEIAKYQTIQEGHSYMGESYGSDRLTVVSEPPYDSPWIFYFAISEDAGAGFADSSVIPLYAGLESGETYATFNWSAHTPSGEHVARENHVLYRYTGPVNSDGSVATAEEGFITERGSVFASIDDTRVVYYTADRVAYSVYYIGLAE